MYTKKEQESITYAKSADLLEVLKKHKKDLRLIRFSSAIKINNLADVIINWSSGKATYFVDTDKIQVTSGAYRSDMDLYLLCKYYFSMSYKRFSKIFKQLTTTKVSLDNLHKALILESGYCRHINRRVYYDLYFPEAIDKVREDFSNIKLRINKTSNIGRTL